MKKSFVQETNFAHKDIHQEAELRDTDRDTTTIAPREPGLDGYGIWTLCMSHDK